MITSGRWSCLIASLDRSPAGHAILIAVIQLAHELGMTVVAEVVAGVPEHDRRDGEKNDRHHVTQHEICRHQEARIRAALEHPLLRK